MPSSSTIVGISPEALANDHDVGRLAKFYFRLEEDTSNALEKKIERLSDDPAWSLLYTMRERAVEQLSACIALFSHGYYAPAEALCRTALEATSNFFHCANGETCKLVLNYFGNYIKTERDQNRLWLDSVNRSTHPEGDKQFHRKLIDDKEKALDLYEQILTDTFSQIGISYADSSKVWPNTFQRFTAINDEVAYRTTYAALCSQTHNDAEDLLNRFVQGASQDDEYAALLRNENRNFSIHVVLAVMDFLVRATHAYLAKFELETDGRLEKLREDIVELAKEVAHRQSGFVEISD